MSWYNKVIWSEGLFLKPQHFQQADRYFEKLLRKRVAALRPYPWGFTHLKLNRDMLALGKLAVDEAIGVFDDGTPFSIPDDDNPPVPLEVPKNLRQSIVYLAIPVQQPGIREAAPAETTESVARFAVHEQEVTDVSAASRAGIGIAVGKLRLRLVTEETNRADLICLGVARVTELRPDKMVLLDENYIPPFLDCRGSKALADYITEIQGKLQNRAIPLAGRLAEPDTRIPANVRDVMFLQLINRYEPLFAHYRTIEHVHPEMFYSSALQLAGEASTFYGETKRPPQLAPYQHHDLASTFTPLMRFLRNLLGTEPETNAVQIPLKEGKHGVHVGQINDKTLISSASFVISAKADMQAERLRRAFPNEVKVGPIEKIRYLVNAALPGIGVRWMPAAPRQIPFIVGNMYFELDRASPFWKEMQASGGLAFFVPDGFPGLEMELWAIRS